MECEVCDTHGQLKCYIKLTVTLMTNKNDHIVERTALLDELIRGAKGQQAFVDQHPRVAPVTMFPDRAPNEASHQLIHSHSISMIRYSCRYMCSYVALDCCYYKI